MAISAQDFIRALKAPSDPPQQGGASKIEIASTAWNDKNLNIPNKAEVLVEWILTRLLKEREKAEDNPLLDLRYWAILQDALAILPRETQSNKATGTTRLQRTWLVPLLTRVPTSPIVTSFFTLLSASLQASEAENGYEPGIWRDLVPTASKCLCALWPIAVPKFSPEALLECFGTILRLRLAYLYQFDRIPEDLTRLEGLVITSYRSVLSNTANKKKILLSLVQHHFSQWVQAIIQSVDAKDSNRTGVYDAGIETIFNVEVLRQAHEQQRDSPVDDALAQSIVTHPDAVLPCLPQLFLSYIQIARRTKSAIFAQGSNPQPGTVADQARIAALKFFARCNSLLDMVAESELQWRTKVALLNIVDSENLFSFHDGSALDVLKQCGDVAVEALSPSSPDKNYLEFGLSVLSTLTRMDYDTLSSALPRILSKLIVVNGFTEKAHAYLDHVLSYHTKTRTMHKLIELIVEACAPQYLSHPTILDSHALYTRASSSPLFHHALIDRLARACYSFLTPGQTIQIVEYILGQMSNSVGEFRERDAQASSNEGGGSRKKRKTEKHTTAGSGADPEVFAVNFSILAKISLVVLTSLPLHTLQDGARQGVLQSIRGYYLSTLLPLVEDFLRQIQSDSRKDTWPWQVVTSAALRLSYTLASSLQLQIGFGAGDGLAAGLIMLVQSGVASAELVVESLRSLMGYASQGCCDPVLVFDLALKSLQKLEPGITWDGSLYSATTVHVPVIVLHLLIDRWLPSFDAIATSKQLILLANHLSSIQLTYKVEGAESDQSLSAGTLLRKALHNAEFWEMRRLRDPFLSSLVAQTSFQETDLQKLLSAAPSADHPKSSLNLVYLASSYHLLLHVPIEYLSRTVRADLLRRALAADLALGKIKVEADYGTNSNRKEGEMNKGLCESSGDRESLKTASVLREFIRRVFNYMGTADLSMAKGYLLHLLDAHEDGVCIPPELEKITSELIEMHLSALTRLATRGEASLLLNALEFLIGLLKAISVEASLRTTGDRTPRMTGLVSLVDHLVVNYKPSDFPPVVQSTIKNVQKELLSVVAPAMNWLRPASEGWSENIANMIGSSAHLLNLWYHFLLLRRWLGDTSAEPGSFAKELAPLARHGHGHNHIPIETCVALLSIAVEEMYYSPEPQVDTVVALYLLFHQERSREDDHVALDHVMSRWSKKMSVEWFSKVLNVMLEGLVRPGLRQPNLIGLLRLSVTMLRDPPEGTLRVTQDYTSRLLILLANRREWIADGQIGPYMLRLMSKIINDRPTTIRQMDLSSVWSILGTSLRGSSEHEFETQWNTFQDIVSALGALIRLRRDLVSTTLPHLGIILRLLILSLRQLRPQLGAKQSRIVTDSLPKWISPTDPLGGEGAKLIARLLTTLTTKTIVRSHGAMVENQKAESLGRPFSKHVACVLIAYIEAMNNPLCILSMEVRRELEPGLFALCEIMGEKNRDALMVSLDSGGKGVLKGLWREYEKQRYVGKG